MFNKKRLRSINPLRSRIVYSSLGCDASDDMDQKATKSSDKPLLKVDDPDEKSVFETYINAPSEDISLEEDQGEAAIKVLLDSNLILDLLLEREVHHLEDVADIFDSASAKDIEIYVTDRGLKDIKNVAHCFSENEYASYVYGKLLERVKECPLDREIISETRRQSLSNIDSAFQLVCLNYYRLDAIITSNTDFFMGGGTDFSGICSTVMTPAMFNNWMYEGSSIREEASVSVDKHKTRLEKLLKSCEGHDLRVKNIIFESFELHSLQSEQSKAIINLWDCNQEKLYCQEVVSEGPIEALCLALDEGLRQAGIEPNYELHGLHLVDLGIGISAEIFSTAVLKANGFYYAGSCSHRDTIRSAFYAYIAAVRKVFEEKPVLESSKIKEILPQSRLPIDLRTLAGEDSLLGITDLSDRDLSNALCCNEKLQEVNLENSRLNNSYLYNSSLFGANLSRACFNRSAIRISMMDKIQAEYSCWNKSSFDLVAMRNANLFHADFENVSMKEVNLSSSILNKVNLKKSQLIDCNLQKVNLDNGNMSFCSLYRVDLSNSILTEVNFKGANLSLVVLYSAKLSKADFSRATLNQVILDGAVLENCSFEEADLSEAQLVNADLRGVSFNRANLSGANLSGADLSGADLSGANLKDSDFRGVRLDKTVFSEAQLAGAKFDDSIDKKLFKLGC